jgi:hypothetical protein
MRLKWTTPVDRKQILESVSENLTTDKSLACQTCFSHPHAQM